MCAIPGLAFLVVVTGCRRAPEEQATPLVIRIAQQQNKLTNIFAKALSKNLEAHFPAKIRFEYSRSLVSNARSIEEGDVELAIIPANVAYIAYGQGWGDLPRPHKKLRGVAVLNTLPIHLIAREDSGIRKLSDIRGKRVSLGPVGSTTELSAEMILEGLRLSPKDISARSIPSDQAVEELRAGKLDAVFNRGTEQESAVEEVMEKLVSVPGVKFIPILRSETESIRSTHPFLRPISIPAGMYGNHSEVETIGVDSLMVCRDDLSEELVYWITRSLVESLAGLSRSTALDPEQVHATPIPLHAGAARYYRERELFH
ncbi:MAG TPA: TAXI family TRAP transporter solute-binding subunit [Terriglobia bacterium]|nr:TAXI family TRAP transporter solute-binding subunit [Terriglobia bacterium]